MMKIKTLLTLSIVANLILGYLLFRNDGGASDSATREDSSGDVSLMDADKQASNLPPSLADASFQVADEEPREPVAEEPPQIIGWENIESEDYLTYIDNLRKIGCPEETIQDIIKADVGKLFQQRRRDFEASLPPVEYWKSGAFGGMGFTSEQLEGLREIQKEKEQVLKTLLGSSYQPSTSNIMTEIMSDPSAILGRQLGFLDDSKKQAVLDAYMGMQEDIINAAAEEGGNPSITQDLMQKAMKARDEALSQALTPEEKFEVDLRMSEHAQSLKYQLNGMDLSEQEFRDMYSLQQKIYAENEVDPYSMYSNSVSGREKLTAADQSFQSELKNLLGDERYTEYEMSRDWQFQELNRTAQSSGADREAAVEAYNIQNQAQQALNDLNLQSLANEDRNQAMQQILDETKGALQQALGDEAFEKYQDSSAFQSFQSRYRANRQVEGEAQFSQPQELLVAPTAQSDSP